jgi:diamine N-acetyltransferase
VNNAYLIGKQVYLRPLETEDAPALQAWINDPDVYPYLAVTRPFNRQAEEAFVERSMKSDHDLTLGIVVREGDRLIGTAGLFRIDFRNRHAGFGIMIGDKKSWNRGYGTEATRLIVRHAFETMNLNRVWLMVYEFNPRGTRAYEKAGFRLEGVLRQSAFSQGRYWDSKLMAVLRDEWSALEGTPDAG